MLSPENLRTLRGLLSARERELERMVQIDPDRDLDKVSDVVDRKELAERGATAEVENAEAARAVGELRQISAARERLLDGTYGRCLDCREDIDLRRLMLQPATSHCMECANRLERRPLMSSIR